MNYSDEEVAQGLEQLGRSPHAKFLQQVLLAELLKVSGPTQKPGAVRMQEGSRNFASELIKALKFEPNANNDGPDAAKLIRGPERRERSEPDRRAARRAAAVEDR